MNFPLKHFDQIGLEQVINNSYDGILVTDITGKILLANAAAVLPMQKTTEEVIGMNVTKLVEEGTYDRSTTMEAIKTRSQVTGLVNLVSGKKVMSTSIPLYNENGEIAMVITNTRSKDLIENFMDALEEERKNTAHYKSIIHYLDDAQHQVLIAKSPNMLEIVQRANLIAKADSSVLILGESGSGKEVIARHIHHQSPRHKEPFIAVNCAAIPHDLMESEFLGYEKGAFSGAHPQGKIGFFQMAHKGTLFLDEIAELPLDMQSKLLRVTESREFRRVGGTKLISTDVRLITATNKDLKQLVQKDLFREDLYYRLNVIPVTLPPLRERPEDIIILAESFLSEFNKKYGFNKTFSSKTIDTLRNYSWPGNVRELRNVIERLVIISSEKKILDLDLEDEKKEAPKPQSNTAPFNTSKASSQESLKEVVKEFELQYINQVLQECNGRIGETANRLGIHRTLLYKKLHHK